MPPAPRPPDDAALATANTARSGMWVSCGRCTTTRLPPMRAAMRSISAASSSLSCTLASRSRCCCTTISVRLADSRMRSKPKPGSRGSLSASSRSRNRRSITSALGHRTPGIDRDRAHRAVGAEKTCFQPPRALALSVHRRDQHGCERGQVHRDHGVGGDRFGKALFHDVIRQRFSRADRRIALPQRLLQQRREMQRRTAP